MPGITVHFLLVYSYAEQKLIEQDEFTDAKDATTAYNDAEGRYRGRSDEFEVVLVGADSIETVMRTHGHYFKTSTLESMFTDLMQRPTHEAV